MFLAYSGGLDTSVIAKWLMEEYDLEVITFTADIGQGEETRDARVKAKKLGIKKIYIEDLREDFVKNYVYPMFRANAIYEGEYFLGTSIARPLISKRLIEIAKKEKADYICHGATGKGNDQVRFELAAYALNPKIKVIAPWREWDFVSRSDLMRYARKHQIAVDFDHGKKVLIQWMQTFYIHHMKEGYLKIHGGNQKNLCGLELNHLKIANQNHSV